jgi:Predicted membrane protein (DUF2254)
MSEQRENEPDPSAFRRAIRRWRLWWRYQLRTIPLREPLRRTRLLRIPEQDVRWRATQLKTGRALGRVYLSTLRISEQGRIARARLPERIEPARTTLALLRLQLPLLAALVVLIAFGYGLDQGARHLSPEITHALGITNWLEHNFSKPSDATLAILLAAAAGGTATILGLILSITLIAWQTTADRYRSTSIVSFLLRERIGSSVVRLLALAFAYSLWVLALFETQPHRPYASMVLALVLATAAVLSLISYRRAGLLGYLPASIANSLRRDMLAALARARRRGSGRSVQDHSRRVVAEDLQIYRDLLERLIREGDPTDISAGLDELRAVLNHYVTVKHQLDPGSLFFVRHGERLPPAGGAEIEEQIVAEGLMNPTQQVADSHWLERNIADTVRPVASSPLVASPPVAEALLQLWAESMQLAWYLEDPEAVEMIFNEVEQIGTNPRIRASERGAEQLMTTPWLLVEAVGNGLRTTPEQILATNPWDGERRLRRLPWAAQQDARRLGALVRAEQAIAGGVITPDRVMIAEVGSWRQTRLGQTRHELIDRALALCRTQLYALNADDAGASVVARMTIRLLLRLTHHDLALPDLTGIPAALLTVIERADGATAQDLRQDAGRAARRFAQAGEWAAAYGMLRVYAAATVLARAVEQDETQSIRLTFDMLNLAACIHGWGEYHQHPGHAMEVARFVQGPFVQLDRLAEMLENHQMPIMLLPTVTYHRWFQPLIHAVRELPERAVRDGGIGYSVEKDHPSPLIARSEMLFGPEECLEDLVEQTVKVREDTRVRLLTVLQMALRIRESR